jgi:hypothetical protein
MISHVNPQSSNKFVIPTGAQRIEARGVSDGV